MPLQRSHASRGISVIQSRIVNARRDDDSVPISEARGFSPARVGAREDHMGAACTMDAVQPRGIHDVRISLAAESLRRGWIAAPGACHRLAVVSGARIRHVGTHAFQRLAMLPSGRHHESRAFFLLMLH